MFDCGCLGFPFVIKCDLSLIFIIVGKFREGGSRNALAIFFDSIQLHPLLQFPQFEINGNKALVVYPLFRLKTIYIY